jgi:site-specific recombinase XerD
MAVDSSVSELVSLKFLDLFFEEGFIKLLGKVQATICIGDLASKYILLYKDTIRTQVNVEKRIWRYLIF